MKRRLIPALLSFGLLAGACTADDPDPVGGGDTEDPDEDPDDESDDDGSDDPADDSDGDDTTTGPIGFGPASLTRFDECAAFLDHVRTTGAEMVGPYGFDGGGFIGIPEPMDAMVEEEAMDEAESDDSGAVDFPASTEAASGEVGRTTSGASGDDGGGDGDRTFSETNVQVEGVDEPDIVKTDGVRILAIAGEQLHYVDITGDGSTGRLRGSVALSDPDAGVYTYGQEIFLAGDRAFVIARTDGATVFATDAATTSAVDGGDAEADLVEPLPTEPFPGQYWGPSTSIIEVDLSNPDVPAVVNRLDVQGQYISGRSIGSTARIAITSPPQDLGFLFPSGPGTEDAAEEFNRQLVLESTADQWIPDYALTTSDGSIERGELTDCTNVHAPVEFSGFDMLSVVTVDLGGPLTSPAEATSSVMAQGDTVYANEDRFYISTNVWIPPTLDEQQRGDWEEQYETAIHRFSIAGDGPAVYEASGSVEGHLLNQFSMNDRDGTFFVATTEGTPWGVQPDTDNQIIALQVDGDRLVEVGKVEDLGLEGERIFSVRYVGDLAYLVTFRQTDPFYVVDLADPTNMIVRGELKIPGFSSYLHPISDDLVIGVGQDATEEGFVTGTKVSLFDVSDLDDPIERDVWTLPNAQSDAEFDHRAFLWWAPTNTAVLPLTTWSDGFTGAVVLDVVDGQLVERGRISQVDPTSEQIGATDCRVIDVDGIQLTQDDGDAFWVLEEFAFSGAQLQLCGANDVGGAVGHFCDVIPVDEFADWWGLGQQEAQTILDAVGVDEGDERIEWCWQDGGIDWNKQIRRTLVIEGSLWTLSNSALQSNDLGSLDQQTRIDLPF